MDNTLFILLFLALGIWWLNRSLLKENFGRLWSYGHPYYWKYRYGNQRHYDDYDYRPCDYHSKNILYLFK